MEGKQVWELSAGTQREGKEQQQAPALTSAAEQGGNLTSMEQSKIQVRKIWHLQSGCCRAGSEAAPRACLQEQDEADSPTCAIPTACAGACPGREAWLHTLHQRCSSTRHIGDAALNDPGRRNPFYSVHPMASGCWNPL